MGSLKSLLQEFCRSSSIHGLHYVMSGKGALVAVFWLCAILMGITTTIVLFNEASAKWYHHPSLTTIESMAMPVGHVQFPTVTVCPSDKGQTHGHGMDRWALVTKLLNLVQMYCIPKGSSQNNYVPCNASFSSSAFDDFGILLDKLHEDVYKVLDQDQSFQAELKYTPDEVLNGVYKLFEGNFTNRDALFEHFETSPFRSITLATHLEKFLEKHPDNVSHIEPTKETKSSLRREIGLINGAYFEKTGPPLGIMLTSILPLYLDAFKNQKFSKGFKCFNLHEEEVYFNDFLIRVSQQLGLSMRVPLHEVPVLFTKYTPDYKYNKMRNPYQLSSCSQDDMDKQLINTCSDYWNTYLRGEGGHPCEANISYTCCWTNVVGEENLTAVMNIMKHARGRGALYEDFKSYTDFLPDGKIAGYQMDPFKFGEHKHKISGSGKAFDPFSSIPLCEFVSQKQNWGAQKFVLPACNLFQPMITTMGLCQTFNSLSVDTLLNKSPFTEAFSTAFQDEPQWNIIHRVQGSGEELGLLLYLDAGSYFSEQFYTGQKDDKRTFLLSMNNYMTPFNMKSTTLTIRSGHRSILRVSPMELRSEDELHSAEPHQRGCYFHDEPKQGSIFKNYTRPGCIYECLAKYAASYCKCAPWDMPFPDSDKLPLCGLYGNYCFNEVMKNGSFSMSFEKEHECDCLPNCNELYYTYTKEEWPIDPVELCNVGSPPSVAARMKIKMLRYERLDHYYQKILAAGPPEGMKIVSKKTWMCREYLARDLAIVNIHYASDMYMKSKQSVKMTFGDQIASLGGTLGLLTGMSLMSLVEVAFWVLNILKEFFTFCKNSKK